MCLITFIDAVNNIKEERSVKKAFFWPFEISISNSYFNPQLTIILRNELAKDINNKTHHMVPKTILSSYLNNFLI